MKRVLLISKGDRLGAIELLMAEISDSIKDMSFDMLTPNSVYDDYSNAYNLGVNRKGFGRFLYYLKLIKFLITHRYDIIHIHSGNFIYSYNVAFIARLLGIKKIIVHSHSAAAQPWYMRLCKKLLNPFYRVIIDKGVATSKEAASSLFTNPEKAIILKQGIDVKRYKFNEELRIKLQKELGIVGKDVYGHIGRFDKNKNHEFLIKVFYEIQRQQPDSVLVLVGEGPLLEQVKEQVRSLNLTSKVIFTGFRLNANDYYNCMDKFIFPSEHEGLGVAIIEALTSGLPVFINTTIPTIVDISPNLTRIYSTSPTVWSRAVLNKTKTNRQRAYKNTIAKGYDIKECINQLHEIYENV